jgi:hypothetical protein
LALINCAIRSGGRVGGLSPSSGEKKADGAVGVHGGRGGIDV